ncbi:hypothetical protein M231_06803 [Tremella mesenterica]|uniref:Uncharacterized protein n=1 Tax=Tremella mesenterica TaxID=5217 RepID=A0A4Q1BCW4_TREME|nr:hypothetical protein M231_06803 [Tremella mesenterica]
MPRNTSQVSLALSSLTARTINQEDLDDFILSELPDEYHEAMYGMFKKHLSDALSKLEDDRLMFFSDNSNPMLSQMYQTARQNFIQGVQSYIHGEADMIFTPEAHTFSCDILDPTTGCGKIEYVIDDLTTKFGSVLLIMAPLLGRLQYQPETVNVDQSTRMSGADRYKNGLQLYQSLQDTYDILKGTSRSFHTTSETVLSDKQHIINPHTLSKENINMESLNELTTLLEGEINGHTPREILRVAENEIMVHSGRSSVNQSQGTDLTLRGLGITDSKTLSIAVQVAISRLELSTWMVEFITENMINHTDGISEVLSIRKMGKDLLDSLAYMSKFTS